MDSSKPSNTSSLAWRVDNFEPYSSHSSCIFCVRICLYSQALTGTGANCVAIWVQIRDFGTHKYLPVFSCPSHSFEPVQSDSCRLLLPLWSHTLPPTHLSMNLSRDWRFLPLHQSCLSQRNFMKYQLHKLDFMIQLKEVSQQSQQQTEKTFSWIHLQNQWNHFWCFGPSGWQLVGRFSICTSQQYDTGGCATWTAVPLNRLRRGRNAARPAETEAATSISAAWTGNGKRRKRFSEKDGKRIRPAKMEKLLAGAPASWTTAVA